MSRQGCDVACYFFFLRALLPESMLKYKPPKISLSWYFFSRVSLRGKKRFYIIKVRNSSRITCKYWDTEEERQARIQQGNKIPSTRSTSIGKRFASAFFAVLLAFFLVPTPAFQIAPAYADELGEAVSAGLMESAQPADSPAPPKVDTSTETVTQDKADPAPDTKDTAKGDAPMGLDLQTPAAPAAPEASTSDKASEEAPETDAASTPDVDASVQDDAGDVATEDETETPADTEISAQEDIGVGINVQGTIRFFGTTGPDPNDPSYNKYDNTFDCRSTNKVCIDRSAFNGYSYASLQVEPRWGAGHRLRRLGEKIPASEKYTP